MSAGPIPRETHRRQYLVSEIECSRGRWAVTLDRQGARQVLPVQDARIAFDYLGRVATVTHTDIVLKVEPQSRPTMRRAIRDAAVGAPCVYHLHRDADLDWGELRERKVFCGVCHPDPHRWYAEEERTMRGTA